MRKLDRYEAKVCFKLFRAGCFGKGHKLVDTVTSGFPSHELDQVSQAIGRLVRDGVLVEHPTRHGKAVHLNAELSKEIYDALKSRPEYKWLPR